MTQDYTIFATYILVPTTGTTGSSIGYGNSQSIHCNYIKTLPIETDNFSIQEIAFNFSGATNFKFLNSKLTGSTAGTGFTANKIYALVQSAITSTTGATSPDPAKWFKYDLTPQITIPAKHVTGTPLMAIELINNNFKIPIGKMNLYTGGTTGFTPYNLTYLNYPAISGDSLSFGDEIYFLGNVSAQIHADVYVTDLPILLNLNEFNSSTNPTWKELSPQPPVAISEIGIYDANKNLVAIGKLNDPIVKDSSISRTIVFDIDF
jgi:hypothetical protein